MQTMEKIRENNITMNSNEKKGKIYGMCTWTRVVMEKFPREEAVQKPKLRDGA